MSNHRGRTRRREARLEKVEDRQQRADEARLGRKPAPVDLSAEQLADLAKRYREEGR